MGTTTSTGTASNAADQTSTLTAGQAAADKAVDQMDAAFAIAIGINAKITSHKTVDGAIETAAQQRPNIG